MQTLQNTSPNWQLMYNKVVAENQLLKRRLLSTPRNADELKDTLEAVTTFMDEMTVFQGAVTCSALYDLPFFERDADPKFKQSLCALLVERYAPAQNLIERSFDLWKENAKV